MGLAQALALIPGVSRSGGTITAGLFLGLTREAATRYSFLLAIPAVVMSGRVQHRRTCSTEQRRPVAAPARRWSSPRSSRSASAYASIAWLLRYVAHHTLYPFVLVPGGARRRSCSACWPPARIARRPEALGWRRGDPPAPATRPHHRQRRRRPRRPPAGRARRHRPGPGGRGRRSGCAGVPLAAVVTSPLIRCRQTLELALPGVDAGRRGRARSSAATATGRASRSRSWPRIRCGRWCSSTRRAVVFPRRRGDGGDGGPRGRRGPRAGTRRSTAEHGPDAVWLACSHGDVIKAIVADALGLHLDLFQRIVADPASVTAIRYTADRGRSCCGSTTPAATWPRLVPPQAARRRRRRGRDSDAAVGGGAGRRRRAAAGSASRRCARAVAGG